MYNVQCTIHNKQEEGMNTGFLLGLETWDKLRGESSRLNERMKKNDDGRTENGTREYVKKLFSLRVFTH